MISASYLPCQGLMWIKVCGFIGAMWTVLYVDYGASSMWISLSLYVALLCGLYPTLVLSQSIHNHENLILLQSH